MEKYIINSIDYKDYVFIISVLDYEIRLRSVLSLVVFSPEAYGKKVIVDLALKSGLDQYRFVAFDIDNSGHIILDSNRYFQAPEDLINKANSYIFSKKEIVKNSFLTSRQKEYLLEQS